MKSFSIFDDVFANIIYVFYLNIRRLFSQHRAYVPEIRTGKRYEYLDIYRYIPARNDSCETRAANMRCCIPDHVCHTSYNPRITHALKIIKENDTQNNDKQMKAEKVCVDVKSAM